MLRATAAVLVAVLSSIVVIISAGGNIDRPRVGNYGRVSLARLSCLERTSRSLPLFTSKPAQVLEVTFGHICDILAAEDAHLEILDLGRALGRLNARGFQVVKILEDHLVGVDMLSDFLPCLSVRNEILRARC